MTIKTARSRGLVFVLTNTHNSKEVAEKLTEILKDKTVNGVAIHPRYTKYGAYLNNTVSKVFDDFGLVKTYYADSKPTQFNPPLANDNKSYLVFSLKERSV